VIIEIPGQARNDKKVEHTAHPASFNLFCPRYSGFHFIPGTVVQKQIH
jgi:hypothetical protein